MTSERENFFFTTSEDREEPSLNLEEHFKLNLTFTSIDMHLIAVGQQQAILSQPITRSPTFFKFKLNSISTYEANHDKTDNLNHIIAQPSSRKRKFAKKEQNERKKNKNSNYVSSFCLQKFLTTYNITYFLMLT